MTVLGLCATVDCLVWAGMINLVPSTPATPPDARCCYHEKEPAEAGGTREEVDNDVCMARPTRREKGCKERGEGRDADDDKSHHGQDDDLARYCSSWTVRVDCLVGNRVDCLVGNRVDCLVGNNGSKYVSLKGVLNKGN